MARAGGLADLVIVACPVCRRSLALADRNGRHVASEAHYPHLDAAGTPVCSPPAPAAAPRGGTGASARALGGLERAQSSES